MVRNIFLTKCSLYGIFFIYRLVIYILKKEREMDRTRELALREAGRYGVDADFVIKDDLPSFEIISEKNRVTIFAPNEVELLYGVYSFAEEFLGWSFFAPGRDRHFPQRVRAIPADGVLIPAKKPLPWAAMP